MFFHAHQGANRQEIHLDYLISLTVIVEEVRTINQAQKAQKKKRSEYSSKWNLYKGIKMTVQQRKKLFRL